MTCTCEHPRAVHIRNRLYRRRYGMCDDCLCNSYRSRTARTIMEAVAVLLFVILAVVIVVTAGIVMQVGMNPCN
jgi:hypothetical protein